MAYNLGIDIGITSVGFAGIESAADHQKALLFQGAHIFEAAEEAKTGASLAKTRREKRGVRRVIRRRRVRQNDIKRLLAHHGFQNIESIHEPLTTETQETQNPWTLRAAALQRRLDDSEFARVLFHIAKRRGFQSNKKGDPDKSSEDGKILGAITVFKQRMTNAGAKTAGEYLSTQAKKRNGNGNYENSVIRDLLRAEVKEIFAAQKQFGNPKATDQLLYEYAGSGDKAQLYTREGDGIAFCQKPLQSSENMVGKCTFYPDEKRAPKCSYTAELFLVWQRFNNCRIKSMGGAERPLTPDEKQQLLDLAHKQKSKIDYAKVRKLLDLGDDDRFNITYRKTKETDTSWESVRDTAEKAQFIQMPAYHALKAALDTGSDGDWQHWVHQRRDDLDQIAWIISFNEDRTKISEKLAGYKLTKIQEENILKITNFKYSVNLSLKAIREILPALQEGKRYDEACTAIWGDHRRQKAVEAKTKIPKFDDIPNPVVNRALAQTRKVINACIRKYGMPETIIIELAREVGKNHSDRKKIEKEQKENEGRRNALREKVAEKFDMSPSSVTGEDILKMRLWEEQKCHCAYSGEYISIDMLRDGNATQIDHILPYSRSWNDSYMNKVLCTMQENQLKGNRTPFEYMGEKQFHAMESSIRAWHLPLRKIQNLLNKDFKDEEQGFKDRALNDTRYIAKELKNHLEQHLDLGDGNRIQVRNGAITSHLRGVWGLGKKDRENDKHHIVDAIILACSTQSMVQRITNHNKIQAKLRGESPHYPAPWEGFRDDVIKAVDNTFISRMPVRKGTGAAHEDTIRAIRKSDGKIIQRVSITNVKLEKLEQLVDKQRNKVLYETLKNRLLQFNNDPQKAFADPICMPSKDPNNRPQIQSIRIETSEKSGIVINDGFASNGDQVRVDVFLKGGKYFLVPIYVHQLSQKTLPNKAITAGKDEKDWPEMVEEDFIFSLYKNDLVKIKTKKEEIEGYYIGVHRGTGSINLRTHDNSKEISAGIKSSLSFEKYTVDYFGNKSRVKREKSRGVAQCDDSESSDPIAEKRAVIN
jgi:CRISPR-associated endonuclease Csn1